MNIRLLIITLLLLPVFSFAQADFEIQVYASPITQKDVTFYELHSNLTANGPIKARDKSAYRFLNESVEITHGFGHQFEMGLYLFSSLSPDGKYQFRGVHLRPRVTAPENWKLPVGASLSVEIGYVKPNEDTSFNWDGEIRPILDKSFGNWYGSFNPNFDFVFSGNDKHLGITPQFKLVYTLKGKYGIGFEYYSYLGTTKRMYSIEDQEHLLGPMVDLYCWKDWEFNAGILKGLTPGSNETIIKLLLGKRHARKG